MKNRNETIWNRAPVFRFVVPLRNFLGGVEVIQFPILTSSHFS